MPTTPYVVPAACDNLRNRRQQHAATEIPLLPVLNEGYQLIGERHDRQTADKPT